MNNSLSIFIVFIVVTLSCGGMASENITYIVQSSATAITSPCTYTICKCSSNICRLRFDLTNFVIAGPTLGTVDAAAAPTTNGKWLFVVLLSVA